jgi:predicted permease
VITAALDPQSWGYDVVRGRAFYETLGEQVAALPGVTAVSFGTRLPLTLAGGGGQLEIAGVKASVEITTVAPGWFDALHLPLVSGRGFSSQDGEFAPRVVVVNETFARRFWAEGSALGRSVQYRGEPVTIVGVARDAKYASLGESTPAFMYVPLAQQWSSAQFLTVRTDGDPQTLAGPIQRAILDIDPALPRARVVPLVEASAIALWPQRIAAIVTGALGAIGLLMATVGLYGVIAWSVSRRAREIGIRLALGAYRRGVQQMIVREGMRLAGWGVLAGLLMAAALAQLLASLLFDLSAWDPVTFIGMSVLFIGVATLASWLPARRASRADPMVVLRGDS